MLCKSIFKKYKMKFVTITGGLGNQMFIYAFCLELRARGYNSILFKPRHNTSKGYGHQGYELKKLFSVIETVDFSSKLISIWLSLYSQFIRILPTRLKKNVFKLVGINTIKVPENFIFYPDIFSFKHSNEVYMGTWQSEKYFLNAKEEVRRQFAFKEEFLSTETKNVLQDLVSGISVSIHIRRGDYLSPQYINGFGGICTVEYYKKAIEYMNNQFSNPNFYIFTDDKEWVKENFCMDNPNFVSHNMGCNSWQDMYLMSQCKHNIIANSSFSWWGAWLNDNPDKIVIAPQHWWNGFEKDDVVPDNWLRI